MEEFPALTFGLNFPNAYFHKLSDLTPAFGLGSRIVQLGSVQCFELGRAAHIQGGVPPAGVLEVLDVAGYGHAELFHGAPLSGVEQFGLHPSPG